jgi:PPOX class probable F420-dependent enzyme
MPGTLPAEVREFLNEGTRVGMLATMRKDGRPWLQPLWYLLDGDDVIVVVNRDSVASHALAREKRAAICVDDEEVPYRFATLECTAETIDASDEIAPWMRRLVVRYRPTIDADRETAYYIDYGVRLARLKVNRVTYQAQVVS